MSSQNNTRLFTTSLIVFALQGLILFTGTLPAQVTFDWATVGNPNNPPDQLYIRQ